ncbi:hypothetical protein QZM22_27255 [Burkholderia oklahomensis]|uniref:hypothetical protein n=1 Tax=Burkholderia oklahomensis TaxID=342113 RepID=UPI002654FBFA|nr:hypothetical protein [Burkholderia oklahomensis]MDN7676091.1 hypothetical protein [Burkholderia oklahomensis]
MDREALKLQLADRLKAWDVLHQKFQALSATHAAETLVQVCRGQAPHRLVKRLTAIAEVISAIAVHFPVVGY